MTHHEMSAEDFELAAQEALLGVESESNGSYQVGNVIFTASSEQPSQLDSVQKAPSAFLLQVAEVLEEVAQSGQEPETQ